MTQHGAIDVAVVGGGLAGLAAAGYLARAGRRPLVLEGARAPGGRARTLERAGYRLNLGPHALYAAGAGARTLGELGVTFTGGNADGSGGFAYHRGQLHTLPVGPLSLLTTGLMPLGDKLAAARILSKLPTLDTSSLGGASLQAWVEEASARPVVRQLLFALGRVATYADAPDRMSAAAALEQMRRALDGVYYLDGGWQTLVDGLSEAARQAGAQIECGARVDALVPSSAGVDLELAGGRRLRARDVVVATSPSVTTALLGAFAAPELRRFAADAMPVRAACLDVALERLPRPRALLALGIDRPLYCSVHTAYAKLAPSGGALVHVAKYLPVGDASDPAGVRAELEELLDLLQPGWREQVVTTRLSPRLVVSHALVTPAGRPDCDVGLPHLRIAGDWVGSEGMLADAALASARRAAHALSEATDEAA